MSRIAYALAAAALSSLIASGMVIAQPASPTTPAPTASEKASAKKKAADASSKAISTPSPANGKPGSRSGIWART